MMKVLEINVDMATPGATSLAIEKAANKLPKSAKFLGTCATPAYVYLFYDVPNQGGGGGSGGSGGGGGND